MPKITTILQHSINFRGVFLHLSVKSKKNTTFATVLTVNGLFKNDTERNIGYF